MEKGLEEFYNTNKWLFEVVGALFVISALLLDLKVPSDYSGKALEFVQFIFLLASASSFGLLIKYGFDSVSKFLPNTAITNATTEQTPGQIMKEAKIFLLGFGIIVFSSLLVLSTFFYLAKTYPSQTYFSLLALVLYLLTYEVIRVVVTKVKNIQHRLRRMIAAALLIGLIFVLAFEIPMGLFFLIIYSVEFTTIMALKSAVLLALSIILIAGLCIYFFEIRRKK